MAYSFRPEYKSKYDIVDIICAISIALSIILYEVTMNFEIVLSILFVCFVISSVKRKGKVVLHFDAIVINAYVFCAFCFCSCIWAKQIEYAALASFRVFMLILFFQLLIEMYYLNDKSVFLCIKLASIIVTGYSMFYYGLGSLLKSIFSSDNRIENSFNNINTLGLCSAIGVCILIYEYLDYNKKKSLVWASVLMFFSLATASRKSFILIFITLGLYYCFVFRKDKTVKHFLLIIVAIVIVIVLYRYGIFEILLKRIISMFGTGISATGEKDGSILLRRYYVKIGMHHFKEHPLLGIGADNGRLYVIADYGVNTYLHNNYVELLCDIGIIGTVVYYFMHLIIFYRYFKYRAYMTNYSKFCLFLEISIIPLDFGLVSYGDRLIWLLFVPQVIETLRLKKQFHIEYLKKI